MNIRKLLLGLMGVISSAAPAHAELVVEHPSVVPMFEKACLEGELTTVAREAAIALDAGWVKEPRVEIDVQALGISKAIERNFDYSKPVSAMQWTRKVDGKLLRLVLATFPNKRRYPAICAITVPGVKAGWPYNDAFGTAVKAIGLKGKSTDLPHYFEYSGKIGIEKHPVRAEIFGRSQAAPEEDTLHLYVAF